MQSDAKSAFYKKGHQNVRPGLHFGGLWGSLWTTLGIKWHPGGIFLRGQNFDAKNGNRVISSSPGSWGGVPINR